MIAKLVREPALILGLVVALLGVLVLFGVDLTDEQIGGIVTFLGALVALLRFVLTPSAEVVTQVKDGEVIAGAAAVVPTGTPVPVAGPSQTGDPGGNPVVRPVEIKPELVDAA